MLYCSQENKNKDLGGPKNLTIEYSISMNYLVLVSSMYSEVLLLRCPQPEMEETIGYFISDRLLPKQI
jgi:hypothetical protein